MASSGPGRAALVRLAHRPSAKDKDTGPLPLDLMDAADRYADCRDALEAVLDAPPPLELQIKQTVLRWLGRTATARDHHRRWLRERIARYQSAVDDMAEALTALHHLTAVAKAGAAARHAESTERLRTLERDILHHLKNATNERQVRTEEEDEFSTLTRQLERLGERLDQLQDDIEIAETLGQTAYGQKLTEALAAGLAEKEALLSGYSSLEGNVDAARSAERHHSDQHAAAVMALGRAQRAHHRLTLWRASLTLLEARYQRCQEDLLDLFRGAHATDALGGDVAALDALRDAARSTRRVLAEHEDIVYGLSVQVNVPTDDDSKPNELSRALGALETDWNAHQDRLNGARATLQSTHDNLR